MKPDVENVLKRDTFKNPSDIQFFKAELLENETKMTKPDFIHYVQSGVGFDPFEPKEELIRITDIAKGLSNNPRYNGQTLFHYSVAQHSVLISRACETLEDKRSALLHDASEGYIVDLAKPFKVRPEMAEYVKVEKIIQAMIHKRYSIPEETKLVKKYDHAIWGNEIPVLFPGQKCIHDETISGVVVVEWSPRIAYEEFLDEFKLLFGSID